MDRTVLHGKDQSGPAYASPPASGNMAGEFYGEDLKAKKLWDSSAKKWLPLEYIPFVYDFAVHGGVQGAIDLGITVPQGTIILDGILHVVTAFLSAGLATAAIQVEVAGDVLATTAKASLSGGLMAIVPDGTAVKAIRPTVDRKITLVVATADLTAGKAYGYLRAVRGLG